MTELRSEMTRVAANRFAIGHGTARSFIVRQYYVYILASRSRRIYTGVTNNLLVRLFQHRTGESEFTARHRITRLVYFETTQDVTSAITREKQIKGWVRDKKIALIVVANPTWDDLAADWFPETTEKADPSVAALPQDDKSANP